MTSAEPDFDLEGIKVSAVRMAQDRPSAWRWLLPPVMYGRQPRRTKAFWHATLAQLTETQRRQYASFRN